MKFFKNYPDEISLKKKVKAKGKNNIIIFYYKSLIYYHIDS